jgi:signal transduction histidine kinase
VFERFFRIDEQSTVGSGLGLSIVKEVATLHNATVSLHTPGSNVGILVRVEFAGALNRDTDAAQI